VTVPDAAGERMLIGTGVATTVNELFAHCADAAGYPHAPIHGPDRAGEVRHSVVDASRARTVLGWTPWTSVADGVRQTIAWAGGAGAA
jgi:nucleoside-diphosphate-sugar epimerase